MASTTFGLPWKHLAVILNVVALVFDVVYVATRLALKDPSNHPYVITLAGAACMSGMALAAVAESSKWGLAIGYTCTAVNLLLGSILLLTAFSYLTGPSSGLWHLMHTPL